VTTLTVSDEGSTGEFFGIGCSGERGKELVRDVSGRIVEE